MLFGSIGGLHIGSTDIFLISLTDILGLIENFLIDWFNGFLKDLIFDPFIVLIDILLIDTNGTGEGVQSTK